MDAYIHFFSHGVGSSDASRPSKARHPVLKPRDLSFSGLFFRLLRPRGVRVPVLQQLVRTPRVSGHVAAGPIYFYSSTFSNPLRHWSPVTGMGQVDEGVTEVGTRGCTVQYSTCISFRPPSNTDPSRRAHIYYVDEGVTEGRMSNRSEARGRGDEDSGRADGLPSVGG
ncbi:hypothetical protein BC827DRAFT_408132 [Russula dissimulans]|nr:hypothetical protein BC827DRAFT_408132 [Russula dissimulans]